ncbi:MAG: tetratricopeptide repeat protein [Verrucomicrobia bacterium]|nr:tetratricopeptide repeat protein [Verrucomicrobiota bacterium]
MAPTPNQSAGTAAGEGRRRLLGPAVLVLLLLIAYLPVWRAGFIWDDDLHLTANPTIVGPDGLREIWTTPAANYFPLVLTNLWFLHALWGLDPLPYHLASLALHAGCALLLWQVLVRLRSRGAWLGAALWALHPVNTESVAWISELKNTQSGVFFLASVLCFLRWLDAREAGRPGRGAYLLSFACGLGALLSKPSTVMLPVVLGLCWWWRTRSWSWHRIPWLLPFVALSAATSIWAVWEQAFHSGAIGAAWSQSWGERIIISGRAIWFYLGKLLWPHPLIFIYPRWELDALVGISYLPALAVVAVAGLLWKARAGPVGPVFFALGAFWIMLFPVLGFFSIYFFRYSFVSDHFQYLASMAPLALVAAGLTASSENLGRWRAALLAWLIGGLTFLTWKEAAKYHDTETLWRATLADNPGCWMASNNLGNLVGEAGKTEEAVALYQAALAANPAHSAAHYNLANALDRLGRHAEALSHYAAAVRHQPDYLDALINYATALRRAGRATEAMGQLRSALRFAPASLQANYNLANALLATDRPAEALGHYRAALRANPMFYEAHLNLGIALYQCGQWRESEESFAAALQIRPGSDAAREYRDRARTQRTTTPP